jgi:hypothetical protein
MTDAAGEVSFAAQVRATLHAYRPDRREIYTAMQVEPGDEVVFGGLAPTPLTTQGGPLVINYPVHPNGSTYTIPGLLSDPLETGCVSLVSSTPGRFNLSVAAPCVGDPSPRMLTLQASRPQGPVGFLTVPDVELRTGTVNATGTRQLPTTYGAALTGTPPFPLLAEVRWLGRSWFQIFMNAAWGMPSSVAGPPLSPNTIIRTTMSAVSSPTPLQDVFVPATTPQHTLDAAALLPFLSNRNYDPATGRLTWASSSGAPAVATRLGLSVLPLGSGPVWVVYLPGNPGTVDLPFPPPSLVAIDKAGVRPGEMFVIGVEGRQYHELLPILDPVLNNPGTLAAAARRGAPPITSKIAFSALFGP